MSASPVNIELILHPRLHPIVVRMTPELAAECLKRNIRNRALSHKQVEKYIREMSLGEFIYTGDPIRFNSDGQLIDGQHRLEACVRSGVEFDVTIVNGLGDKVQNVIDSGRKRSVSDVLKMHEHKYYNELAATVRSLYAISASKTSAVITSQEALNYVKDNPDLEDSVSFCATNKKINFVVKAHEMSALHYIASRQGFAEEADDFITLLKTGIDRRGLTVSTSNAGYLTRETLIKLKLKGSSVGTSGPTSPMVRAVLFRGWNSFVKNRPCAKGLPINPLEVRLDGFDPGTIGLAHLVRS